MQHLARGRRGGERDDELQLILSGGLLQRRPILLSSLWSSRREDHVPLPVLVCVTSGRERWVHSFIVCEQSKCKGRVSILPALIADIEYERDDVNNNQSKTKQNNTRGFFL